MTAKPKVPLVILLHGVGARGVDLGPLAQILSASLPGAKFVAPNAPQVYDYGPPGHQWFSVEGITPATRPDRVCAARAGFDAAIAHILATEGYADDPDRVIFVGFSQGSIMAMDAIASGRWAPGAVVAFSGRYATPDAVAARGGTPVLLWHGLADPVIPVQESISADAALRDLGFATEFFHQDGIGHMISREAADQAGAWLAARFAA